MIKNKYEKLHKKFLEIQDKILNKNIENPGFAKEIFDSIFSFAKPKKPTASHKLILEEKREEILMSFFQVNLFVKF